MKYSFGDKLKIGVWCEDAKQVIRHLNSMAFVVPIILTNPSAAELRSMDILFVGDAQVDWNQLKHIRLDIPIVLVGKDKADAYSALKFGAADMILKPFGQKEIEDAILKSMDVLKQRYLGNMKPVAENEYPRVEGLYFQFKSIRQTIVSVDLRKIRMCIADGNMTYVMLEDGRKEVGNYPISHSEQLLYDIGFIKIHRKYIVNPAFVEDVVDSGNGRRFLKMVGYDEKLPIARRRWKEFSRIFSQTDHL